MTYEKMTGEINLEELEVQAEEVTEASAGLCSIKSDFFGMIWRPNLCF